MPARRRKQSNAMLYTLIIFVGLFIAATTVAVIYYVNAEKYRTARNDLQSDLDNFATSDEQDDVGTIVGAKISGKTWLGTMSDHLDNMFTLTVGGVAEEPMAENKVNQANEAAKNTLEKVQKHIHIDPNTTGLIPIIEALTAELESTKKLYTDTKKLLDDKLLELENVNKSNFESKQILIADKENLIQDVEAAKQDYQDTKNRLTQSTSELVNNLTTEKNELTAMKEDLEDKLDLKEAELAEARKEMELAKAEVAKIAPGPDQEALAYKPDGKIILVDNEAKIVHINIGSDEHVYPGLTFQVYDRGTSVKVDGIGKAEIQVFNVEKHYSVARILPALNYKVTMSDLYQEFTDPEVTAQIMLTLEKPYKERNKDFEEIFANGSPNKLRILNNLSEAHEQGKNISPIILNDIIANLIWDSSKVNVFVISGDFDLDGNGNYDYNAIQRITALVDKWGGRVDDAISIDTDFLVLGQMPQITEKPTPEEQQLDPTSLQTYEASLKRLNQYNYIQERAQALWIPIFKYERFLHFIGYKTQASQAGGF